MPMTYGSPKGPYSPFLFIQPKRYMAWMIILLYWSKNTLGNTTLKIITHIFYTGAQAVDPRGYIASV